MCKNNRLLEKVAFGSGKIIFEYVVILAQCKLYTHAHTHRHTYIYVHICIIRDVNKGIVINLAQISF